jgi:hypothetical protein
MLMFRNASCSCMGDLVGRLDEIKGLLQKNVRVVTQAAKLSLPVLQPSTEHLAEMFKVKTLDGRTIEVFPLAECINVVAFHFEYSTRKFRSFAPPILTSEPLKHVNLMKVCLDDRRIKLHPSFDLACQNILWKAHVRELKIKNISNTERFTTAESSLQAPERSDILCEPQGKVNVSVDFGSTDPFPTLTEPDVFGQTVLEASPTTVSQSRQQDVMLFQLGETRTHLIRVVTSTS